MLHFRYFGIPGRPPPGCLGGLVACIHGPFGGILDHDCGVCSVVRLSSARREDVPMRRSPLRPAVSWRVWCHLSERAPAAVLPRKTGYEEKTPIFLGISILRPIREGFGFTSAYLRNCRRLRDAGVLPIPTTGQPRRDQAEEMPGGVKRPSARQLGVFTNSRSEPIFQPRLI